MNSRNVGKMLTKFLCALLLLLLLILSDLVIGLYVKNKVLAVNFDNSEYFLGDQGSYDVVLFGDSRVSNWYLDDLKNISAANKGISGETTSQMILRYQKDVLDIDSQWVVFQFGINDLVAAGLKGDHDSESIFNKCLDNITTMIDLAILDERKVVFVTVIKPSEFSPVRKIMLREAGAVHGYVERLNMEILRKYSGSIYYIDSNDKLSVDGGYYIDALHLNRDGYKIINSELMKLFL